MLHLNIMKNWENVAIVGTKKKKNSTCVPCATETKRVQRSSNVYVEEMSTCGEIDAEWRGQRLVVERQLATSTLKTPRPLDSRFFSKLLPGTRTIKLGATTRESRKTRRRSSPGNQRGNSRCAALTTIKRRGNDSRKNRNAANDSSGYHARKFGSFYHSFQDTGEEG